MLEATAHENQLLSRQAQILRNMSLSASLDIHLQDKLEEIEKADLAQGWTIAQNIQANKNKKTGFLNFLIGFYNGIVGNQAANGNSVLKSKIRNSENNAVITTSKRSDIYSRTKYARGMMDKANAEGIDQIKKGGSAASAAHEIITKRDVEYTNSRDAKHAALHDIRNTSPEAIAARAELAAKGQLSAAQYALLGTAGAGGIGAAAALNASALEQLLGRAGTLANGESAASAASNLQSKQLLDKSVLVSDIKNIGANAAEQANSPAVSRAERLAELKLAALNPNLSPEARAALENKLLAASAEFKASVAADNKTSLGGITNENIAERRYLNAGINNNGLVASQTSGALAAAQPQTPKPDVPIAGGNNNQHNHNNSNTACTTDTATGKPICSVDKTPVTPGTPPVGANPIIPPPTGTTPPVGGIPAPTPTGNLANNITSPPTGTNPAIGGGTTNPAPTGQIPAGTIASNGTTAAPQAPTAPPANVVADAGIAPVTKPDKFPTLPDSSQTKPLTSPDPLVASTTKTPATPPANVVADAGIAPVTKPDKFPTLPDSSQTQPLTSPDPLVASTTKNDIASKSPTIKPANPEILTASITPTEPATIPPDAPTTPAIEGPTSKPAANPGILTASIDNSQLTPEKMYKAAGEFGKTSSQPSSFSPTEVVTGRIPSGDISIARV